MMEHFLPHGHCPGLIIALIFLWAPISLGVFLWSLNIDGKSRFKDHQRVALTTFAPAIIPYFIIKIFICIFISIYKTILDIPIFATLKKKIEESKLPTLNSSNGRIIKNIRERTLPWSD